MYKYRSRLSRCDMTMFQESAWIKMNISVCVEILNESCISWCRSFVSEMNWLDMGGERVNWWVFDIIWLSDLKKSTRTTFQPIDNWQLFNDEIRLIEDIWKRIIYSLNHSLGSVSPIFRSLPYQVSKRSFPHSHLAWLAGSKSDLPKWGWNDCPIIEVIPVAVRFNSTWLPSCSLNIRQFHILLRNRRNTMNISALAQIHEATFIQKFKTIHSSNLAQVPPFWK
jgi:hypothetical protein